MANPQRTCVGCRRKRDKDEFIRIVRTPNGDVILDPTGKANGRGAYLCHKPACWQKGLQRQRLSHALRTIVPSAQMTQLEVSLQKMVGKLA